MELSIGIKWTVAIHSIEDTPTFGNIIITLTPHQEYILIVSVLIAIAFQHHYNAYEVIPAYSTVTYYYT